MLAFVMSEQFHTRVGMLVNLFIRVNILILVVYYSFISVIVYYFITMSTIDDRCSYMIVNAVVSCFVFK